MLPSSGGYSCRAMNATPLFISNVSFSCQCGFAELLLPMTGLSKHQEPRSRPTPAEHRQGGGRYEDHLMVVACGLAEQHLSTTSPCLLGRATPLFISSLPPAASPSFLWPLTVPCPRESHQQPPFEQLLSIPHTCLQSFQQATKETF